MDTRHKKVYSPLEFSQMINLLLWLRRNDKKRLQEAYKRLQAIDLDYVTVIAYDAAVHIMPVSTAVCRIIGADGDMLDAFPDLVLVALEGKLVGDYYMHSSMPR